MKTVFLALCALLGLGPAAEGQEVQGAKVTIEGEMIAVRVVGITKEGKQIDVMESGKVLPVGEYRQIYIAAYHGNGTTQNAIIPAGEMVLNGKPLDPPGAASINDKDVLVAKVWGWKAPTNATKVVDEVLEGEEALVTFERPWVDYELGLMTPHWNRPNTFLQLAQEGKTTLSQRLAVFAKQNIQTTYAGNFRIASSPPDVIRPDGTHMSLTLPVGKDRKVLPMLQKLTVEQLAHIISKGVNQLLDKVGTDGVPHRKHMEAAEKLQKEARAWLDDTSKPKPAVVKEVEQAIEAARPKKKG